MPSQSVFSLDFVARVRAIQREYGLTRRRVIVLLALNLAATATEVFGLVLLLPIFQYIRLEGNIAAATENVRMWQWLEFGLGFVGLPLSLPALVGLSLALLLLRQFFMYARFIAATMIDQSMIGRIRARIFVSYLAAEIRFAEQVTPGEIVNALSREVGSACSIVTAPVRLTAQLMLAAAYIATLAALNPILTGATFAVLGLAAFSLRKLLHLSHAAGRRRLLADEAWTTFILQRLNAIRLIKMATSQSDEERAMRTYTSTVEKRVISGYRIKGLADGLLEPVIFVIAFGIILFGYSVSKLSIEAIGLFLVILLRLSPVGLGASRELQLVYANLGSLERVEGLLRLLDSVRERTTGTAVFIGLADCIRIRDLKFTYPRGDHPALDSLSLDIPKGSMVALVGPSGGGKSTILDILLRFREPDGGLITIDGIPLQSFDRDSLRRGIAYVPQNISMLNISVREHLQYGREPASEQEIVQALALASAEFVHRLPQGIDTLVGENGGLLSGGQRQRLEIARALLRNARILMFDEPTSNVDAETESVICQMLENARSGGERTTIVVAHRLSTIANADMIYVIASGRVVESGTHTELIARRGWYANAVSGEPSIDEGHPEPVTTARRATG